MDVGGLLGNEAIRARLDAAAAQDRFSHSYLICGPDGSGKHTLAKILAAAMQCTGAGPAAIAGVFLFALYTVFQIPGYYKYGSIKGRVFMYIPVAGFLVTLLLLSKMPAIGKSIISVVESFPILLVFFAVFAIVVMYAVSIFLSIRIMKNKEM